MSSPPDRPAITIIGAGLAGSLLAVLLARRGFAVTLFERFADPRRHSVPAGRSINLALAERGRVALDEAGLLDTVDDFALPMSARMLHDEHGRTRRQPYGQRAGEVIWSVHRARLNLTLVDAAEEAGVTLHFSHTLVAADLDRRRLTFRLDDGSTRRFECAHVIGADGAGSALRQAMDAHHPLGVHEQPLGHSYKEFSIPADAGGRHRLTAEALHIWPRGGFMMIALPNPDGSFTCTLFLDHDGDPGFAQLQESADLRAFLERHFASAVALMDHLDEEIADNPVSFLGTLYVDRWHLDDRAVLLGDAAHAIVPFHGQGMNAAFEDALALARLLEASPRDLAPAFAQFHARRKPDADAIAEMALDNYLEMRERVRDQRFHLRKQLEWELERALPGIFIPRYSMVMFHPEITYSEALERGRIQDALLQELTAGKTGIDEIDLSAAVALARGRLA